MMDCARCIEELTAFLDGELNPADSERVRSHLDTCASCTDELRSLREAADFVESHQRELELRPGSWNLVRARISAMDSPSPFRFLAPNRWRIAMASLAIIAALGIGYIQYHQVQRRSLDKYIAQYMRDRRAQQPARPVFSDFRAGFKSEDSRARNPFAEFRTTITDNPFRLEDR
jgi:anti-sigma factor RsiW